MTDTPSTLDWADEVGYPGTRATPGVVASPSNWTGNPVPHIHLPGAGRDSHVPVEPAFVRGSTMVTEQTIERLRWHAGLREMVSGNVPSISSCTWPKGCVAKGVQEAIEDCLHTLAVLNRELNGEMPSVAVVRSEVVPLSLVYAVTEIA